MCNLAGKLRRAWRGIRRRLESFLFALGARSPLWARMYYCMWNQAFLREQASCLAGRLWYARRMAKQSMSSPLLRRNIHRLEKGLLMRPRRVPFALDYIGETVNEFILVSQARGDSNELRWAQAVLREYFQVHKQIPDLQPWERAFEVAAGDTEFDAAMHLVPYCRDLSGPPSVTLEGLYDLAVRRRSVRWFLPRVVEREKIDRALEVAALAPSACNRQPFRFLIVDQPTQVCDLVNIAMGMAGWGYSAPVVVVVIGQLRHFSGEHDRHLIYVDAALAVMSFLLALEAQGLSSCCVNWPDIEVRERAMINLLKLEPDERVVMLVALGYPDPAGLVASSVKKPLSLLRSYNVK